MFYFTHIVAMSPLRWTLCAMQDGSYVYKYDSRSVEWVGTRRMDIIDARGKTSLPNACGNLLRHSDSTRLQTDLMCALLELKSLYIYSDLAMRACHYTFGCLYSIDPEKVRTMSHVPHILAVSYRYLSYTSWCATEGNIIIYKTAQRCIVAEILYTFHMFGHNNNIYIKQKMYLGSWFGWHTVMTHLEMYSFGKETNVWGWYLWTHIH